MSESESEFESESQSEFEPDPSDFDSPTGRSTSVPLKIASMILVAAIVATFVIMIVALVGAVGDVS